MSREGFEVRDGVRIRFDSEFDGGAWPGPLAGREAVAGEAWLGPLGLLEHLETMVGLLGPTTSNGERAAELVPRLAESDGFWSKSAELDPLGSARELLRWRDELTLAGWRGDDAGMPARVAALANVTRDLPQGVPDRLWGLVDTLDRRSADVELIELLEPEEGYARVWRGVFERLRAHGTRVERVELQTTPARGDLGAARGGRFGPALDGSLQLLRPDGPWAAAEEVAAWLASQPDREATDSSRWPSETTTS